MAEGSFVFIDYKNGVMPQVEIKYKRGDKVFIHRASHTWTKFSGKTKIIFILFISINEGIGWYFNKFFPHTELFGRFITNSIETGLVEAWRRDTLRGMRAEYYHSQQEKILLPDEAGGGEVSLTATIHGETFQRNLSHLETCRADSTCWGWDCLCHLLCTLQSF